MKDQQDKAGAYIAVLCLESAFIGLANLQFDNKIINEIIPELDKIKSEWLENDNEGNKKE